ncbi:hypothetical protein PIB30_044051 [Stylosanthes scabra]|uniref:Uncharacterized protein n=1 Tax=Stylosanthes scabra TaxID=79078 RepID=A0ABU6TFE4_9FABA|nr:hypothetical protein [Stylosanthes scabra]
MAAEGEEEWKKTMSNPCNCSVAMEVDPWMKDIVRSYSWSTKKYDLRMLGSNDLASMSGLEVAHGASCSLSLTYLLESSVYPHVVDTASPHMSSPPISFCASHLSSLLMPPPLYYACLRMPGYGCLKCHLREGHLLAEKAITLLCSSLRVVVLKKKILANLKTEVSCHVQRLIQPIYVFDVYRHMSRYYD